MAKAKGERGPLVGAAVLRAPDLSALTVRRPIERGYLVNADVQRDIWSHTLGDSLRARPGDASLLLTEPVLNLASIQEATDQVWLPLFRVWSLEMLSVRTGSGGLRIPAAHGAGAQPGQRPGGH